MCRITNNSSSNRNSHSSPTPKGVGTTASLTSPTPRSLAEVEADEGVGSGIDSSAAGGLLQGPLPPVGGRLAGFTEKVG